jgi:hypothetical protein
MKIASWNVRGLGRVDKRKEVRKLVGEKHPLIVCLQETKLQACDDFLCTSVWGDSPFGFSFRPSVGASGGLLTLWDTTEVEVWSSISHDHALWCHGQFLKTGEEFWVVNVYAPCDFRAKQRLWDSLSLRLQPLRGMRVCVCVGTLMLCGAARRGDPQAQDIVPLIRLPLAALLMTTSWLTSLCVAVSLPGTEETVFR